MLATDFISPKKVSIEVFSEFYDKYAPVLYGNILRVVPQGPIADKILEKVFVAACTNNFITNSANQPQLMSLLNEARKKSKKTMNALNIFRACCSGANVCLVEK